MCDRQALQARCGLEPREMQFSSAFSHAEAHFEPIECWHGSRQQAAAALVHARAHAPAGEAGGGSLHLHARPPRLLRCPLSALLALSPVVDRAGHKHAGRAPREGKSSGPRFARPPGATNGGARLLQVVVARRAACTATQRGLAGQRGPPARRVAFYCPSGAFTRQHPRPHPCAHLLLLNQYSGLPVVSAEMARTRSTTRQNVGNLTMARRRPPVWHPTLTTAAEQGEQHLEAALEAEVEVDVEGGRLYEVNPRGSFQHSGDSLSHGDEGVEGRQSPFPPQSPFGIVPYVVWHGRHVVAESYLRDLRADQDGVALVRCLVCWPVAGRRGKSGQACAAAWHAHKFRVNHVLMH